MKRCRIDVEGVSPGCVGLTRAQVRAAAYFFAERSAARVGEPFRVVAIVLQNDEASAAAHVGIMGVEGPTDVITQRYDPMPGEAAGVYGELYVNVSQAVRAAPVRGNWGRAEELLLYVAHGMDHLSGADDISERDYVRMRRRELAWIRAMKRERPVFAC